MAKYLLPCSCGQTVVIEPRQAGQSLVCACGKTLSIPTVLQIRNLELAQEPSQPAAKRWGGRQQLILVGTVVVLAAMVLAGWYLWQRPIAPADIVDPAVIRKNIQNVPLWDAWTTWQKYKEGIDTRRYASYDWAVAQFWIWLSISAALAAVGGSLIAAGMLSKGATAKPRRAGR